MNKSFIINRLRENIDFERKLPIVKVVLAQGQLWVKAATCTFFICRMQIIGRSVAHLFITGRPDVSPRPRVHNWWPFHSLLDAYWVCAETDQSESRSISQAKRNEHSIWVSVASSEIWMLIWWRRVPGWGFQVNYCKASDFHTKYL